MIPETYEEWYHCITVDCGIELNSHFIEERISALKDQRDGHTQSFIQLYGAEHYQNVLSWFHQARRTLVTAGGA